MRTLISLTALLLIASAVGCAPRQMTDGFVKRIGPGDKISDFQYVGVDGTTESFTDVMGDFTILAFNGCAAGEGHSEASDDVNMLVKRYWGTPEVRVVGVDIHTGDSQCSKHEGCHIVSHSPRVASICNASGDLRDRYGLPEGDWIVLLGPQGHVISSSSADEMKNLETVLEKRVKELSHDRVRKVEAQRAFNSA